MAVPTKIYRYHVANLREIELALGHTERLARGAIASRDPQKSLRSLLRLYAFLIGAWAECRLRKLLHEPSGFQVADRNQVINKPMQLEQWQTTVDVAFRKHHGIPKARLVPQVLGVSHAARREALHDVLDKELRNIIEIRNKLAHGQWVYPLNDDGTAVLEEKYKAINKENLLSLEFKYALVRHVAECIHDLVVSRETFERDFDTRFRRLLQVRTNLKTRSYDKYAQSLVERRKIARTSTKRAARPTPR
jgi:hypothetical protein